MRWLIVFLAMSLGMILLVPSCAGQSEAVGTPSAAVEPTPTGESMETATPAVQSTEPAAVTGGQATPGTPVKALTILYTNDGLGEIDPCG